MSADLPIAVAGAGAWGTALAVVAAFSGRPVALWSRSAARATTLAAGRVNDACLPGIQLPSQIRPTAELGDLADAGAILLATPAQSTRAMTAALGTVLPDATPIVLCAKGLEQGSNLFLSDVVRATRPRAPAVVLSGPSFARDVARGLPTAVTLASTDGALAGKLAAALSTPAFRIYDGTDVRGVEIGGAAKNVLAIACGAVSGSGLGESAKAALMARGFAELLRFAEAYGGERETLMGLSGLGDLVLTCSSSQSRNFAFGERLGRGVAAAEAAAGELAEGALSAAALVSMARARSIEMPIATAVADVIVGRVTLPQAIAALLRRPLAREHRGVLPTSSAGPT